MSSFLDKIVGDLGEKKKWRQTEARAKVLPEEYATAYNEMKKYIFRTAGTETIEPYVSLVDMLEEAAASNRQVLDITGPNVAAFVDDLVRGKKSYFEKQREKLNRDIAKKLEK